MHMLKILALFGMTFGLTSCIYALGRFVSSLDIRNDELSVLAIKAKSFLKRRRVNNHQVKT